METRGQKDLVRKNLENSLKELGLYEEGMLFEEMKDIIYALENSVRKQHENCNQYRQDQLNQIIMENDSDIITIPQEGFLNSTMIGNTPQPTSFNASADEPWPLDNLQHDSCSRVTPYIVNRSSRNANRKPVAVIDSDDEDGVEVAGPIIITVQAQVHHSIDWSPPHSTDQTECYTNLKRSFAHSSSIDSAGPDLKRSRFTNHQTPTSNVELISIDSGVNWDERGSSLFDESLCNSSTNANNSNNYRLIASTSSVAISDDSSNLQENNIDAGKVNIQIGNGIGGIGTGSDGDDHRDDEEYLTFL